MTRAQQAALIYLSSMAGAAVVSYAVCGRRGVGTVLTDAVLGGIVGGTALNLAAWVLLPDGSVIPLFAESNPDDVEGTGRLTTAGVQLLSRVKDNLFDAVKVGGVKIGPIPEPADLVRQDAE